MQLSSIIKLQKGNFMANKAEANPYAINQKLNHDPAVSAMAGKVRIFSIKAKIGLVN